MKSLLNENVERGGTNSSLSTREKWHEPFRRDGTVGPGPSHNASRLARWHQCSERWGRLMIAARAGDQGSYDQLLRELDLWLRAYYARRLPHSSAEDARQEALLAIHAKRETYCSLKPFGAWVAAIARHKWVDRLREATRYQASPLIDEIAIEDHEEVSIDAATLNELLGRLKPAQQDAIRLVKLRGLSIAGAAGVTGQSAALVKVNIHRGLKKLASLVS